ncbi:hypothetical protein A2160_05510 [Candidatus Beckwithbacteria bacterium RBG_13_42_9]|uniref:Uncharacterized protein n=1 Tax=Candidatus Beckwithbacteria bacterium RBG_13_42_9 TaxID=1797457 RepID=A0A1F5E3A9_9BACT|nr:MAG: hypothetical protein A2160_05510 [Candidatus Beckwithbacteria bacterium RBG_13_42_9]
MLPEHGPCLTSEALIDSRLTRAAHFFPLYDVPDEITRNYKPRGLSNEEFLREMQSPQGASPDEVAAIRTWGDRALAYGAACEPFPQCVQRNVRAAIKFAIDIGGEEGHVTLVSSNGLQRDIGGLPFVSGPDWSNMVAAYAHAAAISQGGRPDYQSPLFTEPTGCLTLNEAVAKQTGIDPRFCARRFLTTDGKVLSIERRFCPSQCGERTVLAREDYALVAAQILGLNDLMVGVHVIEPSYPITAYDGTFQRSSYQLALLWKEPDEFPQYYNKIIIDQGLVGYFLYDRAGALASLHRFVKENLLGYDDIFVTANLKAGFLRLIAQVHIGDRFLPPYLRFENEEEFAVFGFKPKFMVDIPIDSTEGRRLIMKPVMTASKNIPCLECMVGLPKEGVGRIYVSQPDFPAKYDYYQDLAYDVLFQQGIILIGPALSA